MCLFLNQTRFLCRHRCADAGVQGKMSDFMGNGPTLTIAGHGCALSCPAAKANDWRAGVCPYRDAEMSAEFVRRWKNDAAEAFGGAYRIPDDIIVTDTSCNPDVNREVLDSRLVHGVTREQRHGVGNQLEL